VSEFVLAVGDKLHIATRRLFAEDAHLHFVGETSAVSGDLFRVAGYAFVYDPGSNSYFKHPELRTRLFSISDPAREITVLPRLLEMGSLQYEIAEGRLMLVDGRGFTMEIAEFGSGG
jgi:hypothetical protein